MKTYVRTKLRGRLKPIIPAYRFVRKVAASLEYRGCRILSSSDGNAEVARLIRQGEAAAINRIGVVELNAAKKWQTIKDAQVDLARIPELRLLNANAGVFPMDHHTLACFFAEYQRSMEASTHITIIRNLGEGSYIRSLQTQPVLFEVRGIDPFYWGEPWTHALANKKVLIASPFAATIEQQYRKREEIWTSVPGFMPSFDLVTVRVPLSGGITTPEQESWSEALDVLRQSINDHDYDVLIAGAGAFAPSLTAHAKQAGKIGINLGGSTQILFGIKGARWDEHPAISKWFNDSWVRPSDAERPMLAGQIENACYW